MYGARKTLLCCLAVTAALPALSACDSQSGIPTESDPAPSSSATATSSQPPSRPAGPATGTRSAPAAPVGAVPGNPAAAGALQPWIDDLVTDPAAAQAKCWTIAPLNTASMYSDQAAILAAVAQPGRDGQFAVTWAGPTQTVSVRRSEIASGYACPYVYPTGTQFAYDDADARHTVRRYLARLTGKPVYPADTEKAYPLICDNAATWDPDGTGAQQVAPLSENPNKLTGVTGYVDSELTSQPGRLDYTSVSAPVTAAGTTANKTFTLRVGPNGYCIGDVA